MRPRSDGRTCRRKSLRSRRSSLSNLGASANRPATRRTRSAALEVTGCQPCVALDDVRGDEGVLQVEGRAPRLVRQDRLQRALFTGSHPAPRAGRGADPRVLYDRGQVDILYVPGPLDHSWVEAERGLVGGAEASIELQGPVDAKARLGLAVGAIKLDVSEGPLGFGASFLDTRRPSARSPRRGSELTRRSAAPRARVARRSWPWTRPRPGKDHFGTTIGWPRLS